MAVLATLLETFGLRPKASASNTITTSQELERVLMGGMRTRAGVDVSAEVALMVAAVSAAVTIISETVAQLPLIVYRRQANGDRSRAESDGLWSLLHDRPNSFQDAFQFREMLTLHLALWGNCYAYQNRTRAGRLMELLPIHPDRVRVEQDEDYRVTYKVALPNGEQTMVAAADMLHIRDRSLNGYQGVSRLKMGRDSIGLALVAERWGAQLFGNAARPAGLLTSETTKSPEQMKLMAESWRAAHGGENALGTAVLDGAWKWVPLVMKNTDAQFLETRKFQIAEIARLYRVPPHMLADLERATFSNIEHQSLEFVKFSLMPWLRRWEMAINTQVIGARSDLYAEFLVEGLLRGDTKSRYEAYAIALEHGWMNRNEVRVREGMNREPGLDEFTPAENLYGNKESGNEPAETA